MSTGKKKIKIELEDAEGGKYNLSLEGNLSTDKIQKVLKLVESLNITNQEDIHSVKNTNLISGAQKQSDEGVSNFHNTIGFKIWRLIETNFSFSSFSSSDIVDSYEEVYGEQLQQSLISTYLSRYSDKNKLIRSKRGKEWIYRLIRIHKDISTTIAEANTTSQPGPLTGPDYTLEDSKEEVDFLRQNALSTVYDLRL